jgi:hypothetical protein
MMQSKMPSVAPLPSTLTAALKEWAVAVEALAQGDMILLLRKGGIREQGGSFSVEQPQVWLYPTYEHQKPHLLKPEYADRVTPVASGWHPEQIEIQAWATISHVFQVSEHSTVEALLPFHIWNLDFASERLKWKPKSPLSVLLLRVYRLPQPQTIAYRPEYGGCKSWIELQENLAAIEASPVLSEAEYRERVEAVRSVLGVDGWMGG